MQSQAPEKCYSLVASKAIVPHYTHSFHIHGGGIHCVIAPGMPRALTQAMTLTDVQRNFQKLSRSQR